PDDNERSDRSVTQRAGTRARDPALRGLRYSETWCKARAQRTAGIVRVCGRRASRLAGNRARARVGAKAPPPQVAAVRRGSGVFATVVAGEASGAGGRSRRAACDARGVSFRFGFEVQVRATTIEAGPSARARARASPPEATGAPVPRSAA